MMENKVEHTNLNDNAEQADNPPNVVMPKYTPENTPHYHEQLNEESVQWFTRFADEFARPNHQPKYGVKDTMQVAVAISARIMTYPLVAMRMKDGSPLPSVVEEMVLMSYLAELENHIHTILAKRDAAYDKLMQETSAGAQGKGN